MGDLLRIVLTARNDDATAALDALLPLLPLGVHARAGAETTELIALGERHQLWPAAGLADACGPLLVEPPREETIADLHDEIDRLRPAFEIGGRVVVRAPLGDPPADDKVDVVIDRVYGFGTGAHPTTRMALEMLLDVEPGGAFADFGCGAGVLVIAAAKLGWEPVTGIELSRRGAEEARANAERNAVPADIRHADLRTVPIPSARTAVVNVSDAPEVHERLASADWNGLETLIVSGLKVGADLEPALEHYRAGGLAERDRKTFGTWAAVRLGRDTESQTPPGGSSS